MFYYSKTDVNAYGLALQKSILKPEEVDLYISSEIQIVYPKVEGLTVREMTRYEKFLNNLTRLGLHEYADSETSSIVFDELYTNPNYTPEIPTTSDSVPNEVLISLQGSIANLATRTTTVEAKAVELEEVNITQDSKLEELNGLLLVL